MIGPGGAGKSIVGKLLSKKLKFHFIDLDNEFCEQIENIGEHIKNKGYENYARKNSKLFYSLLGKNKKNTVFALSSGFLVHEELPKLAHKHLQSITLKGKSILLLPSKDINKSTKIIVKRQLSRGFGLNKKREEEKFRLRYPIYKNHGDIKIFSTEKPETIVERIILMFEREKRG